MGRRWVLWALLLAIVLVFVGPALADTGGSMGGGFPAELVSCPHCGAPAPGRNVQEAA